MRTQTLVHRASVSGRAAALGLLLMFGVACGGSTPTAVSPAASSKASPTTPALTSPSPSPATAAALTNFCDLITQVVTAVNIGQASSATAATLQQALSDGADQLSAATDGLDAGISTAATALIKSIRAGATASSGAGFSDTLGKVKDEMTAFHKENCQA